MACSCSTWSSSCMISLPWLSVLATVSSSSACWLRSRNLQISRERENFEQYLCCVHLLHQSFLVQPQHRVFSLSYLFINLKIMFCKQDGQVKQTVFFANDLFHPPGPTSCKEDDPVQQLSWFLSLRRYIFFTWRALLLSRMRTSRGLESSSDWTDGNSRVFKMFKSFFTPS